MTTDSPTEKEGMGSSIEGMPLDTVHTLLSHHRRRAVLELLLTHDRALTLTDLRNELVESEQGAEITEISGEAVKRVHASLHHTHVPKLAEAGIVDYDQERKIVEPTETLRRLEPFYPLLVDQTSSPSS